MLRFYGRQIQGKLFVLLLLGVLEREDFHIPHLLLKDLPQKVEFQSVLKKSALHLSLDVLDAGDELVEYLLEGHVSVARYKEVAQCFLGSHLHGVTACLNRIVQRLSNLILQSILEFWALPYEHFSQLLDHSDCNDKLAKADFPFVYLCLEVLKNLADELLDSYHYAPLPCKADHFKLVLLSTKHLRSHVPKKRPSEKLKDFVLLILLSVLVSFLLRSELFVFEPFAQVAPGGLVDYNVVPDEIFVRNELFRVPLEYSVFDDIEVFLCLFLAFLECQAVI